jgi:hypothetical protein
MKHGNGNEPVAMKPIEKAMNSWQGSQLKDNEPMAKISGWHGNTAHMINPVGEERTIKARSKNISISSGCNGLTPREEYCR